MPYSSFVDTNAVLSGKTDGISGHTKSLPQRVKVAAEG